MPPWRARAHASVRSCFNPAPPAPRRLAACTACGSAASGRRFGPRWGSRHARDLARASARGTGCGYAAGSRGARRRISSRAASRGRCGCVRGGHTRGASGATGGSSTRATRSTRRRRTGASTARTGSGFSAPPCADPRGRAQVHGRARSRNMPALLSQILAALAALPAPASVAACDDLDPAVCLYRWPNDRFTRADPATDTGRRLRPRPRSDAAQRRGQADRPDRDQPQRRLQPRLTDRHARARPRLAGRLRPHRARPDHRPRAVVRSPPFRRYDDELCGIPTIKSFPATGSLFGVWDVGPLREEDGEVKGMPCPPTGNVPNRGRRRAQARRVRAGERAPAGRRVPAARRRVADHRGVRHRPVLPRRVGRHAVSRPTGARP